MNYQEFREEVLNELQGMIPKEVTVRLVQAEKLNSCVRFGISFDRAGVPYSPTIYLEPFYRSFQRGKSLQKIAMELLRCYEEELNDVPESVDRLQSYESARQDIYCKLIHFEKNRQLLQDTPHIKFLDFAIVAYFEVDSDEMYKGSVLIKDYYPEFWHVTEDELIRNALVRTKEKKGMFFRPMSEILTRYISEDDGDIYEHARKYMFVLTNAEKYLGAVLIYDPEVLSGIAKELKDDFYLLPASVHEWVIIPAGVTADEKLLLKMVRDINRLEVLEEEVLSDNIYFYSAADGADIRCISGQKS